MDMSYEEHMTMVKKDGRNLVYVPDEIITEQMCEGALNQNLYSFKYIPTRFVNPEMCKRVLGKWGNLLEYIPKAMKTQELCDIATKTQGSSIMYVPEEFKTFEMCKKCVDEDACMLEYVPDKFKTRLSSGAVNQDCRALEFVLEKDKTIELCADALWQDPSAVMYIPRSIIDLCEKEVCLRRLQDCDEVDSIVRSTIVRFAERAKLGKAKYGVDMDREDLGLLDWIEHSIEEKMDDLVYMMKIRQILKAREVANSPK